MHLNNMGKIAAKNLVITAPYYEKCKYGNGYIVIAPTEKKVGQGRYIQAMSPVKKVKTQKAAIQHVLAISQSIN